ncbi:MAG: hypothetical protein QM485_00710 [Flavobacteriaceae bacterium]
MKYSRIASIDQFENWIPPFGGISSNQQISRYKNAILKSRSH